jgi:CheY-like chemotaxis protein
MILMAHRAGGNLHKWDVFISHASEDKVEVARPLRDLLTESGLRVWLDEEELNVGDSLRGKINKGIAASRFGAIIISPNFFAKHWPRIELDGLASLETQRRKVILPIWHRVNHSMVKRWSPLLADRLALDTGKGLANVAAGILKVVGRPRQPALPKDNGAFVRVLIIEDEEVQRAVLAKMFEYWGMQAEQAADGFEALEALEDGTFDVIITDLLMPRMDGFEFMRRLEKKFRNPPPVIVVTAFGSIEQAMSLMLDLHAFWFLEKPVSPTIIRSVVNRAVAVKRGRP